jgi:ornithine cyclodeaminase
MGLMPVAQVAGDPAWALKAVTVAKANRARGLDTHQGVMLLFDGLTGLPQAVIDASAITALRTAATSAVATLALARPDVSRVAILGAGTQARAHLEALRLLLPDAEFTLWSRFGAGSLAEEMGARACADIATALRDADVICTATAADKPLIDPAWLMPGAHINAVGASRPDARELGSDLIAQAELFTDSRLQAATECGEYLLPLAEKRITADHLLAELGEVLAGLHPGRSGREALTVFKSLGTATQDLAAAKLLLRKARSLGEGRSIDWTDGQIPEGR